MKHHLSEDYARTSPVLVLPTLGHVACGVWGEAKPGFRGTWVPARSGDADSAIITRKQVEKGIFGGYEATLRKATSGHVALRDVEIN